jgi:hypothetical protein
MTSHCHEGFNVLPESISGPGTTGQAPKVDTDLIGRLVGAAYDACTTCKDQELDQLMTDPPTTARLVELACRALRSLLNDLPTHAVDEAGASEPETPELWRIVTGIGPDRGSLYETVAAMDDATRRSTAATALDVIVNDLTSGGALDGAWRPNTRAIPW